MSLFEELGGEAGVGPIVDRFVDRCFEDRIIGYLFEGKDREAVKRHERAHTALLLGAEVRYEGRPVVALHRPMRIHAGHFRRRLALLRQEILRGGLSEAQAEAWLAPQRALEAAMTDGTDCGPDVAGAG
jgi:truncated hemoglobin YjbI